MITCYDLMTQSTLYQITAIVRISMFVICFLFATSSVQAGVGVQECLYAATVSLFALQQFEEAMELCGELISQNPDSTQVMTGSRKIQFLVALDK